MDGYQSGNDTGTPSATSVEKACFTVESAYAPCGSGLRSHWMMDEDCDPIHTQLSRCCMRLVSGLMEAWFWIRILALALVELIFLPLFRKVLSVEPGHMWYFVKLRSTWFAAPPSYSHPMQTAQSAQLWEIMQALQSWVAVHVDVDNTNVVRFGRHVLGCPTLGPFCCFVQKMVLCFMVANLVLEKSIYMPVLFGLLLSI